MDDYSSFSTDPEISDPVVSTMIKLTSGGVHLTDALISSQDVASYLAGIKDTERLSALTRAAEVGAYSIERAQTGQDMEFVRREVERLLQRIEQVSLDIPATVEQRLSRKIGTEDGQLLAPLKASISDVSSQLTERTREVRTLLTDEIDPAKESTVLGKTFRSLRDILDPDRKDSVQGLITTALNDVTAVDGALTKTVKTVVAEAVKPLADEVNRLGRDIRGQEAALEAVQQTIEKGASFEEQVVDELCLWAAVCGAEVHHVGSDNRPGDILVVFSKSAHVSSMSIVIETRDRQRATGRKVVTNELTVAIQERGANAGIYLSRSTDGLGREIGEWSEGECAGGSYIATTHPHLKTALRFLSALHQLATVKATQPDVDLHTVSNQIEHIRTAVKRVQTINRKVTDVRSSADDIQTEAEALRDDIRSTLIAIEDAIRVNTGDVSA